MYEFIDRLCNVVLLACATSAACLERISTAAATTRWLERPVGVSRNRYTRVDKIKGMNITLTHFAPQ